MHKLNELYVKNQGKLVPCNKIELGASFYVWEVQFANYWGNAPDFATNYMNGHPTVLVVTNNARSSLYRNPLYSLFGYLREATLGYANDISLSSWLGYKNKNTERSYKEELDKLTASKRNNLLKTALIDEVTRFLRSTLLVNTILLDITFPKKTKDLQEILLRYSNLGWKLGGGYIRLPGTDHLFVQLFFNPYI